ncbi:MAG: DNA polymerase IV [Culicoidibacterales bacterium]
MKREDDGVQRIIFHIDMNSFFASCEVAHDPALKGKPVVISGKSRRRGVITTATYEAREFGIHSGMPISEAIRKHRDVIILPVNFELYRHYSKMVMEILNRYCKTVEQASIDEAYLDMSALEGDYVKAVAVAKKIQETIYKELKIGSSIGISYNRFLAKMASDMKKPMGITLILENELKSHIWPMKLSNMHGVGPKIYAYLKDIFQIETIGEFANITKEEIRKLGKENYYDLWERANGNDMREIVPDRYTELSSIGHSTTFPHDIENEDELLEYIQKLSRQVIERLNKKEQYALTVQITIRNANFQTITRAQTVLKPFNDVETLYYVAESLFLKHWNGDPLRLLGVAVSNFEQSKLYFEQMTIDNYYQEEL